MSVLTIAGSATVAWYGVSASWIVATAAGGVVA
jgi:hypothetical protein